MKQYFHDVPPLKCAESTDWVYIENGTIRIPERTLLIHGNITCDYIPYLRGNDDFTVVEGKRIKDFGDKAQITSDFFRVECSSTKRHSYTNIHSGIAYNAKLHERSSTISIPKESTGLNVMMFGLDSTSRMTMMKNFPKSHKCFVKKIGAMVLEGYNIVDDGKPQALLPILTGQTELELPDAREEYMVQNPLMITHGYGISSKNKATLHNGENTVLGLEHLHSECWGSIINQLTITCGHFIFKPKSCILLTNLIV